MHSTRRGRGFVHRPERYHVFGAPHPLGAAAPYAPSGDLSPLIVWVLDQGRTESCGGHGTSQLIRVSLAAAGVVIGQPSPGDIWGNARCLENPPGAPLPDAGIDPSDLPVVLSTEGVSLMATNADGSPALTPDGRISDVWSADDVAGVPNAPPANVGDRPSLAEDEASRTRLLTGLQLLNPAEADFEDHVCSSIGNDKAPIGVGIHASAAFEAWGDSYAAGKAPLADTTGFASDDGHWVGVYAYLTLAGAAKAYWIGNSWGPRWGTPKGGIWVTGDWLRASAMVALQFKCALKAAA